MTEAEQEWGSEVAANEPCSRKGPALDSHFQQAFKVSVLSLSKLVDSFLRIRTKAG
jgi:hypothetical protein